MADKHKILGYDPESGKPVVGWDPNSGAPIYAPEDAATPNRQQRKVAAEQGRVMTPLRDQATNVIRTLPAVAGAGAALLTSGASIPAQAAASGALSGIGSVISNLVNNARGVQDKSGADIAAAGLGDAALGAGGTLGGEALGRGLRYVAPKIAEGALRMSTPLRRKFGRFGENLSGTLIPHAQADKELMLRELNRVPAKPIADRAAESMRPNQQLAWNVGLDPSDAVEEAPLIQRFRQRAPAQTIQDVLPDPQGINTAGAAEQSRQMIERQAANEAARREGSPLLARGLEDLEAGMASPATYPGARTPVRVQTIKGQSQWSANELDDMKGLLDDVTDAEHRAIQKGAHPNSGTPGARQLAREMGAELNARTGGDLSGRPTGAYGEANQRIMRLQALKQAAQGRVDIPARGLENLLALYSPTPIHLALRAMRVPVATHAAAKGAQAAGSALMSPETKAALLAALLQGTER
jgi:hypothetical protein